MSPSCETLLLTEMAVLHQAPVILYPDVPYIDKINGTEVRSYKFFVDDNVSVATWYIKILKSCPACPDLGFYVQANAMPSPKSFIQSSVFVANGTGASTSVEFYPQENAWHYVDLEFFGVDAAGAAATNGSANSTSTQSPPPAVGADDMVEFEVVINLTSDEQQSDKKEVTIERVGRKYVQYPVLRQTFREFFMFDYDLLPDENGTVAPCLNLTGGLPTAMRFTVGEVYDIGGTLSFAIAMKQDMKGNNIDVPKLSTETEVNVVAEKLVAPAGADLPAAAARMQQDEAFEDTKVVLRSNQTIIICMRLEEPGIPKWPDKCIYGRNVYPAASIINNTDVDTGTGKLCRIFFFLFLSLSPTSQ